MPNTTVSCPMGVPTLLTVSDVSSLTFQVQSGSGVQITATVGAVPPADADGSLRYAIGEGELNVQLSDLSPGVAGTRVYATATDSTAKVSVSYA